MQVPKTGRIVAFTAPFLSRRPELSVFDLGASTGGTLAAFEIAGATRAAGVEISPFEVDYARARGHDVATGTLRDYTGSGGFDLAVVSGTIDHLLEPAADLARLRGLLKPDGFLYVAISDVVELARWRPDPLKPEHLTYYTSVTLRSLVETEGFQAVRWAADTAAEAALRHDDVRAGVGPWLTIEGLFRVAERSQTPPADWEPVAAGLAAAVKDRSRSRRRVGRAIRRFL
jgi:SAM-dependent methyltransferase